MTAYVQRPAVLPADAQQIALELYSVTVRVRELDAYCDRNFLLENDKGDRSILKIAHTDEVQANLELQNQAMRHLELPGEKSIFPTVMVSTNDREIETVTVRDGQSHLVRRLSYLPGRPMALIENHSPELLRSLGEVLGRMDQALISFDHVRSTSTLVWDLKHVESMLTGGLEHIVGPADRSLVEHFLGLYRKLTAGKIDSLRQSFIHNDANNYNILVASTGSATRGVEQWRVSGLIDFGDVVFSQTINNLAICLAYIMLDKADPIEAAVNVVRGYAGHFPLMPEELEHLFLLACMRVCLSATMAAAQRKAEPENEYLSVTEQPAWTALNRLKNIPRDSVTERFVLACE
jgi:Ser/Thr protein kinase RdoA (MazF antagonist)